MRLRQFEMETSYGGDPEQLQSELGQDWQGKETLREIFSHMITEHFGNPGRVRDSVAQLEKLFFGNRLVKKLEPEDVLALLAYIKHSKNKKQMANENQCLHFIRNYRETYIKERLEGILTLLWASIPDYIYPGGILQLTKTWSKADRQNPQLKLMQIMALEAFGEPTDELLDYLDKAMKTARDRGDEFALQKGSELRKKIEAASKGKHFDPPFHELEDEDDDEFSDDEFNDDELAQMESGFEEMYQKWRSLDDDERMHFEKKVEAITGKLPAKALLEIFKERMKADKRKSTFPGNKTIEADNPSQMDFPF